MFGPLPKWRHRPPLDGLRAVAALVVLLFHAGMQSLSGGYIGVDVFFVLSGFLITSILLRELGKGGIGFLGFYARRARRLLPAALVVLLATLVAYRLLPTTTPLDFLRVRPGAIAAALYGSNWWFLAEAQDYFARDHGVSPFLHYWSLSVEEQFYLVWPVLLTALGAVARRSTKAAFAVVVALTVASLAVSHAVVVESPMQSYFGTHARAWQPLAGAAVALGLAIWPAPRSGVARVLGVLGLSGLVAASLDVVPLSEALHRGELAVGSMVLLLLGLEGAPGSSVARLLSLRPARVLGNWSYAIYLWHWPVVVLLDHEDLLPPSGLVRVAVLCVVTVLLSALSYELVEQPVRRISLQGRRGLFVGGALVTALVAAGAAIVVLPVDDDTRALAARLEELPVRVGGRLVGTGPHVVLVGDSHMRLWQPAFEALAMENGWSLSMRSHDACPWPDLVWLDRHDRERVCDYALEEADLVVLASRSVIGRPVATSQGPLVAGDAGWLDEVVAGSRRAVEGYLEIAEAVVILERLPEMEVEPGRCLSSGESDCSTPAVEQPGDAELDAAWRALAAEDSRVHSIDFDELICPGGVCPAEVQGVVTRKDTHHLTADYARLLAPELAARLPEGYALR